MCTNINIAIIFNVTGKGSIRNHLMTSAITCYKYNIMTLCLSSKLNQIGNLFNDSLSVKYDVTMHIKYRKMKNKNLIGMTEHKPYIYTDAFSYSIYLND